MVAFNKFNTFVEDSYEKVHDLDTDAISIYLSNTAPSASLDSVKADLAEIATGNGYSGPVALSNVTGSQSSGTYTLDADDVTITASGGAISQFQYVVFFNNTPASPADPLIGWWDNGSAVDLADGESFTVAFDAAGILTHA